MDTSYIYTQKRKEFGKPCTFTNVGPNLLTEIESNEELQKEFYSLSSVNKEVDNSARWCLHEVNTDSHPSESRGMNHTEGGWPVSVDFSDEDGTTRFRKKLEKDRSYVNTVKAMGELLETFVKENNAIDIYEEYFAGEITDFEEKGQLKISAVLTDPYKMHRKIMDVTWSLDSSKIAGAYVITGLDVSPKDLNTDSYVWDVKNNVSPLCALSPEFSLHCVSFSPTDMNFILGGYSNGQIGLWDIRVGGRAQQASGVRESHVEKVSGVKWLNTVSKTEIFSSSTDGKVKFWDVRLLSKPTETINLEENGLAGIDEKFRVSCVEYDPTVPDKFMLGIENGKILVHGTKPNIKINAMYDTQSGPVLSIERNAFFPQLFATCDPMVIRIWSEGSNSSPILNMISKDGFYTDISWSSTRPSLLYVTETTGVLQVWDISGKYTEPIASISLDKETLLSISISDPDCTVACGSVSGKITILTPPDYFKSTSDYEMEVLSKCIINNKDIIKGKPRSERLKSLEL